MYFKSYGFLLLLMLSLITHKTIAQNSLSAGASISKGTNSFPLHNRFGLGATLLFRHQLSKQGSLRFSVSYDHFSHSTSGLTRYEISDSLLVFGKDRTIIPIRVGYDHYIWNNNLFVFAEVGFTQAVIQYYNNETLTGYTYAFGLGYKCNLSKNAIITSAGYNGNHLTRYNYPFNLNYINLKIAYCFEWKRKADSKLP